MDWIDIILAKGSTPEGQITTYAAKAEKAAQSAIAAEAASENAVNNINSIIEETVANNELAQQTVTTVNNALSNLENITLTNIDKLVLSINQISNASLVSTSLTTTYPDNTTRVINNLIKFYTTTGQNADGGMTQKAITAALNQLESRIRAVEISGGGSGSGTGGGGSTNLGPENVGKVVIVGPNGEIIPSDELTEEDLLALLAQSPEYSLKNCTGLTIDYENKTYTRSQEAKYYSAGADFNKYVMFGGRMRCNVDDDGRITAFYGDSNYREDGSNGQVMIYQPKFYYNRIINKTSATQNGEAIESEQLILSPRQGLGFKLHPLFFNKYTGQEVPYVLISAYEGSVFNSNSSTYDLEDSANVDFNSDKLSSIAGAKPVSGLNKTFNVENAEKLAQNRGIDWHITNFECESANQMLEMVEFGSLNGQHALEGGVSNVTNNTRANCSAITGSTSILGDDSGAATETSCTVNGTVTVYTDPGKRAISYRGMENPWGNIWRMIGGAYIYGDGALYGGQPCVLTRTTTGTLEYQPVGFNLPNTYGWISNFGKPNENFDWIYIPVKCGISANSAVPVGDNLWATARLNAKNGIVCGGMWYFDDSNGPFYYACDLAFNIAVRSYSARLLNVPSNESVITANQNAWRIHWEARV